MVTFQLTLREEFAARGHVLIVDDQPAKRYLMAEALRREGFSISEAATGREALDRTRRPPLPSVVILDVHMPDVDGFEVVRRLKSTPETETTPIVMVSSYFTAGAHTVRGLEEGAAAYLPSPDPQVLVATVKMLLRVHAAEAELRRTAEFRERLLGIVSHDLRNPLQAVSLSAEALLRREPLSEEGRRQVERIHASSVRMRRMISDLLDFTRGRLGGGIPIEVEPADFFSVCREVVEELRQSHPHREIHLETRGDGRGSWDVGRVAQVMSNLVSNALKYSPPATAVRVQAESSEDSVVFSVHNEGPPIPQELIPLLFDPFKRGQTNDTAGLSKGLGLGLYIVRQLVLSHGGAIDVTSSEAEGTSFIVVLPRQPPPSSLREER